MTISAIIDQHLAQAQNSQDSALADHITALKPLAGDRLRLLAEIDEQLSDLDQEQYDMARFDTRRDDAYQAKFDALGHRFRALRRLELDLKTAN